MDDSWKLDLTRLLQRNRIGFLSTSGGHGPEVSMAPFALFEGDLLLHLSGLARHTKNLELSSAAGFMICAPEADGESILSLARVSLQGDLRPVSDQSLEAAKAAYLKAVAEAEPLFDFADFRLFRFSVTEIYWIGGFGSARALTLPQWRGVLSGRPKEER